MKLRGKKPLSASIMAADKIRPAALKVGIRLEPGQRFDFYNFRHSLVNFFVSRGKDVKTIQELLRHAKVSTTLDLYSQAIDAAKLEAQVEIAVAIRSAAAADWKLRLIPPEKRPIESWEDVRSFTARIDANIQNDAGPRAALAGCYS